MQSIIDGANYATLALCANDIPYSLPVNFVYLNESFYFHGSKKGKKIEILNKNRNGSLSIVVEGSLIPSYFSSNSKMACPATQFFSSIIADGVIEFVSCYEEKCNALNALMQKLQPQGGYIDLKEQVYKNAIDATSVYKLIVKNLTVKNKYGQKLPLDRVKMIIDNLQKRDKSIDRFTIDKIKEFRDDI